MSEPVENDLVDVDPAVDEIVEPPLYPLLELAEGPPTLVDTAAALAPAVARLAEGTGPVAVDAERASGYKYSQRAYLVQLRRAGSGTVLIDPIGCPDLSELGGILGTSEWVLHAANQDLACLAEVGLVPGSLFDTELAARLAGFERVGLATMVEVVLGVRLEKGHSSADWSKRPLTESMLKYAALDVEVLLELRVHLEQVLREQGKWEWAQEEFAAVLAAPPPPARIDPWRRTSGIHRVRNARQLAAIRVLWYARDALARSRDIAPGRLLPDTAIIAAASAPATVNLMDVPGFTGRAARRYLRTWQDALTEAAALPDSELPRPTRNDGPPPANRWADKDPVAASRLARVRAVVTTLAEKQNLPPENLLEPAVVRRVAWTPPQPPEPAAVGRALGEAGARPWQVGLTSDLLAEALVDPPVEPEA